MRNHSIARSRANTPKRPWRSVAGIATVLAAGALVTPGSAQTPDPTPNTYTDANVPLLRSWNGINALSVNENSLLGVTYLYPNTAIRDADAAGARNGTGSVAFISWDNDDGSGRVPGIQTVTDDFLFPVQNCIMVGGERESEDFPGTIVPKTCSDPEGSSKRFRLEVTSADVPVDLVFDTGMGILCYKGVRDPSEDGGVELAEFRDTYGIGRIYRVIMKFHNETGERVTGLRVEVGTGVGDAFVPLTLEEDGVALELRELVEREFFVGETGAPPRAVWNPQLFAMFARKLFHDGSLPGRFPNGFFDTVNAGFFNPQSVSPDDDAAQFIYSGATFNSVTGIHGALTRNYFSIPEQQGVGSGIPNATFGYMMYGDISPYTIGRHDSGIEGSETDATLAWWDGNVWRYGVANNFEEVPATQLQQWAALLIGVNDDSITTPERFSSSIADDLASINMDVFLRIQDMIVGADGMPRHETITMRVTAVSADGIGVGGASGTETPLWVQPGHEAPPLATYMPATGTPVALNDFAYTLRNEDVEIRVLDNDLLDGSAVPNVGATTVVISAGPTNGTLSVDALTNVVTYTPGVAYVGADSFTYSVDYDNGTEVVTSNVATVSVRVTAPPDPTVPVAANDSGSTIEDMPMVINVLANDTLAGGPIVTGPNVMVAVLDAPLGGTAVVNADNTITYTANSDANFTLLERFTYTVTVDGVVSNAALVTVRAEVDETVIVPEAVNDSAAATGTTPVVVNVLANDTWDGVAIPTTGIVTVVTQPANGVAVVNADRTITYTAHAGFTGSDAFTYSVSVAGVVSNTATVTVVVAPGEVVVPPEGNVSGGSCSAGTGTGAPLGAFLLGALGLVTLGRRSRRTRR